MNDHDVADDDPERPGAVAQGAVGTAALLGFNLVLLVWSLRRLVQQDMFDVTTVLSQPGVGDVLLRGFVYCFTAAVTVGYLWFAARVLRLCGVTRPVRTLLVSIGVSAVLILLAGVLLRSLVGPNPRALAEFLVFPLMAAGGHAVVVRFASRDSGVPGELRPTSRAAVASAGMLGLDFVLAAWAALRFLGLFVLGIAMSSQQVSQFLVVSLYCVVAAVLVVQVWFLVRMMRLTGVARPVSMLLLAVGVSAALGILAGVVLWALWAQWEVLTGYAFDIPLFALLAAVGFGVTVRLARRTRVLAVLAVVAPLITLGGVLALTGLR